MDPTVDTTYAKALNIGLVHRPMLHRGARSDVADRSWHFFGLPSLRSPELKRAQLDHKLWLPQWGCGEKPISHTHIPI